MPLSMPPPADNAPPPQPGGLGERIINGLRYVAERILSALFDPIAAVIGRGIEVVLESMEAGARNLLDASLRMQGVPPDIRAQIVSQLFMAGAPGAEGIGGEAPQGGALATGPLAIQVPAAVIAVLGAVIGFVGSYLVAIGQNFAKRFIVPLQWRANREVPLFRIAAEDGVMAERRLAFSLEAVRSDLLDLGVDATRVEALIERSYRWLTSFQIEELYYRGITSPERTRHLLAGVGLRDDQIDELMQSFTRLPSASDLQRFGIREVFTPELRDPLRYPEPGPRYYEEMAKLGFNDERAEWYWMAHWRLPSLTQGYDMFRRLGPHRGRALTFSEDDLRELMRRDDMLSKYWDALIAVQWRPMNRLDIWRLATSGRISREEAAEHYMDYGYHPDLARHIAEIATEDRTAESRTLTQSLIQDAYKRRVIPRDVARAALLSLRFRPEDADLVLTISDLQKQSERAGERTSIIRQRYISGLISDTQATGDLAALGKPQEEISDLLELWRAQLADKTQVPPVGTLEGWYKRRIISGPQAQEELRHRGYNDLYVGRYLLEWDQEIQETEERLDVDELRRRQAQIKIPTRADLATWAKAGLITIDDLTRRLAAQGYSAEDAANYARLVGLDIAPPGYTTDEGKYQVATLRELYRRGYIAIADLEAGLVQLGMPPDLASAIADYETAKALPKEA